LARKKAEYKTGANESGASLGFEQKLWAAADKTRSYTESA